MSKIKVLAIDGSTTSSGIAIFDNTKLVHYECIATSGNVLTRIQKTVKRIRELYDLYNPTDIIMQEVLPEDVKHNQVTFKALMYLQAAIAIELNKNKQKIQFYIPSQWRKICGIKTGKGIKRESLKKASKELVKKKYNIDVNDDISDAICIGNAYVMQHGSAF